MTIKDMSNNVMCANNYAPVYPTPPSEILKAEVEYRGITQRKLAEDMGLTYSVVNELLNGRRPLTAKTALLFEAVLGTSAEGLLRMQATYNIQVLRKDTTFMLKLASIAAVL